MSIVAAKKYPDKLVFAADSIRISGYLKAYNPLKTGYKQVQSTNQNNGLQELHFQTRKNHLVENLQKLLPV